MDFEEIPLAERQHESLIDELSISPIPSSLTAQVISTLSGISLQVHETLTVDGLFATAGLVNSGRRHHLQLPHSGLNGAY